MIQHFQQVLSGQPFEANTGETKRTSFERNSACGSITVNLLNCKKISYARDVIEHCKMQHDRCQNGRDLLFVQKAPHAVETLFLLCGSDRTASFLQKGNSWQRTVYVHRTTARRTVGLFRQTELGEFAQVRLGKKFVWEHL